jgi:uncharacterized oxidoreductase
LEYVHTLSELSRGFDKVPLDTSNGGSMELTGNTILVTGGGSGIGRGLAEAFHRLGNKVIVAGRRKANLADVVQANQGMDSVELDVSNPESVATVSRELIAKYPKLNVLLNNAGIMLIDDVSKPIEDTALTSEFETNFFGTVRVTSAFIEHLKAQESATILNVSSVLGFVPLAFAALYSATKAGIHSYSMSLRYRLKGTSVEVQEIAPPWVQTELLNSSEEPRAMPLKPFIEETIEALKHPNHEVLVESAKPFRANPGVDESAFFYQMNDWFSQG